MADIIKIDSSFPENPCKEVTGKRLGIKMIETTMSDEICAMQVADGTCPRGFNLDTIGDFWEYTKLLISGYNEKPTNEDMGSFVTLFSR